MKKILFILAAVCAAAAHPPGAPLAEYGPAKMAAGFYFDHSGQDLFSNPTPSMLNTAGAQITYAPFSFIHFGGYIGAAEFDHQSPTAAGSGFDADYTLTGGGSGKLFSPRFLNRKVCLFASGSAGFLSAEGNLGHTRQLWEYHGAGGLLYRPAPFLNIGLGAEAFFIDGQQSGQGQNGVAFGNADNFRGLFALEFYPKTNPDLMKGQPFMSAAFRFTPNLGWDEHLGLKNGSISVCIGVITDFLYGKYKEGGDEGFE